MRGLRVLVTAGVGALLGPGALAAASAPRRPPLGPPSRTAPGPTVAPAPWALPDYPRPELTRTRWLDLDGTWQFARARSLRPPFGHNLRGRIVVPFPPESALSGVRRHYAGMWYRRTFTVPAGWLAAGRCRGPACPRLLLHFGAVDYEALVYVNGTLVATHLGGYTSFTVDITKALRSGPTQELIVGVANPVDRGENDAVVGKQRLVPPDYIYFGPSSGIWQSVWLEPVSASHIDSLELTPDPAHAALVIDALTTGNAGAQQVQAVAYDGNTVVGAITGAADADLRLHIRHPRLWTPETPFLYTLRVTLSQDAQELDSVGSYFGMRSISVRAVDGEPRLLLNGQFVFELGVLDEGYWPGGLYAASSDAALRNDLLLVKTLRFNTVRMHEKVETDRFYYWADRIGILVWQDMPSLARPPTSAADEAEFERELHAMIEQLQVHPSVVGWIIFNEGWGEYDPTGVTDEVKAWDPSRPVDTDSGLNCCASLPDTGSGDVIDSHGYPWPKPPAQRTTPGYTIPAPADRRARVVGEFGGLGSLVAGRTPFPFFAWKTETDAGQLSGDYATLLGYIRELEVHCDLSGAIYTQLYDVAQEADGLVTGDRAVLRADAGEVQLANESVLAAARAVQPRTCSEVTPPALS